MSFTVKNHKAEERCPMRSSKPLRGSKTVSFTVKNHKAEERCPMRSSKPLRGSKTVSFTVLDPLNGYTKGAKIRSMLLIKL